MLRKNFRRALGCASLVAIAAVSTPAAAQQIDRIVVFGDSYPDQGNAFALGYANPQALAIYPDKRFSSGQNYIDVLASLLHAPVDNYAIGGAFGGTNNGTLCFDPFYAPGTSPLGRRLSNGVAAWVTCGMATRGFSTPKTTRPPPVWRLGPT